MLEVVDLRVHYVGRVGESKDRPVRALDGVSFTVTRGEVLGIVGESGSGKSTLALALMGLARTAKVSGKVRFNGVYLPLEDEQAMAAVRWRRIALVFQGTGSGFDPVYRIGTQIVEPMLAHLGIGKREAAARAADLMELVGLSPDQLGRYPHQLSGGERQRAMVAMALSCDPELLILDEPTASQDVLGAAALLDLFRRLKDERKLTSIIISHDLTDIARLADRTAVLYAGRLLETGRTTDILNDPAHPYTWGLVNAFPLITRAKDLCGIRGTTPDPINPPSGCRFHPRCSQAKEICKTNEPRLAPPAPAFARDGRLIACHLGGTLTILSVQNIRKTYWQRGHPPVEAVRGACLTVREGEVVGLVGRSGSGKSTLARIIVGLESPDSGRVTFEGHELTGARSNLPPSIRSRIQLIFQDPYEALSPRLSALQIVREPLDIQGLGDTKERNDRALQALEAVNLATDPDFLASHTHELSGGQLQRLAIARALVLNPKLIVADEPVSMLDASERAKVLQLLKRLQNERGLAMLLISHDLALVRKVSDRIAVMCMGEIVELRPSHQLLNAPQHPYTRDLISASHELLAMAEGSDVGGN